MSIFRDRHAQHDGRHVRLWCGLSSELLIGLRIDVVDGLAISLGLGPFYVGIGGYSR